MGDTFRPADYVVASDARDFIESIPRDSVDLFVVDPPYYGIVRESWDNQWAAADVTGLVHPRG